MRDRRGRRLPCRYAEADLHDVAVQMTIEIPPLQLIDKVADVLVVHVVQVPQVQVVSLTRCPSSCCRSWRRQSLPQLPRDLHDKSLTCPLLSTTGAYGPDSAENLQISDHRFHSCSTSERWSMSLLCQSCSSSVESRGGDSRDPTAQVVEKIGQFLTLWRWRWRKGFLPVLRAFFALRPLGRRVPALPRLF